MQKLYSPTKRRTYPLNQKTRRDHFTMKLAILTYLHQHGDQVTTRVLTGCYIIYSTFKPLLATLLDNELVEYHFNKLHITPLGVEMVHHYYTLLQHIESPL